MIKTWHIVTFALLFTLIIASKPLASIAKQPVVKPEMTPTIVVSPEERTKYPALQGASCGTIGPQGEDAAPILPGTTNGTIGPPGLDATALEPTDDHRGAFMPVLILAFAASSVIGAFRTLRNNKKNALWIYGGVAVIVLMTTGFLWGTSNIF